MLDISSALDRCKKWVTPQLRSAFAATIIVGLITHLFIYTNVFFMHDAMQPFGLTDGASEAGRFLVPFLQRLFTRGLTQSIVIAVWSLLFMSIAVWMVSNIFSVQKSWCIWLIAALIVTFPATTMTYAYYSSAHLYAFALMTATFSVYCFTRIKPVWLGGVLGIVLAVITMSTYQAYFTWIVSLLVLELIMQLLQNDQSFARLLKDCICYAILAILSVAVYYAATKLVMLLQQTQWQSYYGEAEAWSGILTIPYWLEKIRSIYTQVFEFFFVRNNLGFLNRFVVYSMRCVLLLTFLQMVLLLIQRRAGWKKSLFFIILLAAWPLCMNGALLMVDDYAAHELMIFSFVTPFIWTVLLLNLTCRANATCSIENTCTKKSRLSGLITIMLSWVLLLGLFVIVDNNRQFASSLYLQMKLEYDASYSDVREIVSDIHHTDGYTSDTVVYIASSTNLRKPDDLRDGFSFMNFRIGNFLQSAYNTQDQFLYFVQDVMNESISFEKIKPYSEGEFIQQMPSYPNAGYMQWVDGKLVIKLW